ncbi:4-hydroxybenzoate octaprenyltransferase [Elioraea thermophila]|uniref:4-hydroxybenzoate octaprenyltransferase n=1 Tax=Elioraea thermophila TaxID=2185104 RepID=UPI000DF13721|nr:4-hydroxybenzoate octaprenyltransferase [Elioraea thermophila]
MNGTVQASDIRIGGLVGALPSGLRPYALLMRLDRPIGTWLLFLPGLWGLALGGTPWPDPWLVALFAFGAVVMRGAGCVINDLWDRDIDRLVARTAARPLASGAVDPLRAMGLLALLLAIGFAVLIQLHPLAIVLGIASLIPVTIYPAMKRITWWPQAFLGLTFNWGVPMGYAAATGTVDAAALVLYAGAFFWTLGYDTIYAHQDRDDDALIGVRSTALLFGDATRPFLAVCYGAAVALIAAAGILAGLSVWFYVVLAAAALLLARQVVVLDIRDAPLCGRLFRANREVGLVIAAAVIAGRVA